MQDIPFYEYQITVYDDIINDLKPYIKYGDVDLVIKNALNQINKPIYQNCSRRYYATYIRPKLLNIIKNKNV